MNITVTKLGNGRTSITLSDSSYMDDVMIQETEFPDDEYDSWMDDAETMLETSLFKILGIWDQRNEILTVNLPPEVVVKRLENIFPEGILKKLFPESYI